MISKGVLYVIKGKKISLILSLLTTINFLSSLLLQRTYAVSDNILIDDMCFAIRSGTTDQLILTSYSGSESVLDIPETIEGKTVTAIDDKVFAENCNLNMVFLPDTINYFGADVFRNSSIQSVNIPTSLRVIPSYTFNNCQELESVSFHDDIAIIANTAFKKSSITVPQELRECITGVTILSSDTSCQFSSTDWNYNITCKNGTVNAEIIRYNGNDEIVSVPSKLNSADVTVCGENTFPDINTIKIIIFPDSMSSLNFSFAGSKIEEVILRGVDEIPASEFENCNELKQVTLSDRADIYTIGSKAFRNCSSLKNILFPQVCEQLNIESHAFENSGILELTLNCSSNIGASAFSECGTLKTVELSDAIVSSRAFMNCNSLTEIIFHGDTVLADLSVFECDNLVNVVFDDSQLTSYNAFRNCPNLYTINSEKVFSSVTGDFIPEYKDFIFTHFSGSDNVGFINEYVTACVERIVDEYTDESMNDIEKVIALHDWVCNKSKYSEGNIGDRTNHNDASVFMNEYTVCEGYARACNLLYHAAGIESYYVHGSNHAWNIVNIEGLYFHVDTTWDDIENSRKWFMKSDDELRKEGGSHSEWTLYVPSPLHEFQGDVLPECKYHMGDVNADGSVSVADLVSLQNFILGRSSLEKEHWVLSDVCYDGKINVFDMIILRRKVIEEYSTT